MKQLMNPQALNRSLIRMAHEILERNQDVSHLVLIGIKTRGIPLAHRLKELLETFESITVEVIDLDVTIWRDDLKSDEIKPDIDIDVDNKVCIIVDDVFYSGRTIRAAMDAIIDYGRPLMIQLCVLVDRGHRELPIRADYVGKNVPTAKTERVFVKLKEVDGVDGVFIDKNE